MENIVKQRIKDVLKFYKTTQNKLAGGNSALQKRLSNQLNGDAALTFQTINSILEAFPDVSAEWLLRGDGAMLKSDRTSNTYNIKGTDNSVNVRGDKNAVTTGDKDIIAQLLQQNQQLITMLAKKQ